MEEMRATLARRPSLGGLAGGGDHVPRREAPAYGRVTSTPD